MINTPVIRYLVLSIFLTFVAGGSATAQDLVDPFLPTISDDQADLIEMRDRVIPSLEQQIRVTERKLSEKIDRDISRAIQNAKPQIPPELVRNLERLNELVESGTFERRATISGSGGGNPILNAIGEQGTIVETSTGKLAEITPDEVVYETGQEIPTAVIADSLFIGCVNDTAMFRNTRNEVFFVPKEAGLNNETFRLIGGCRP
jgi:hypothetical protein